MKHIAGLIRRRQCTSRFSWLVMSLFACSVAGASVHAVQPEVDLSVPRGQSVGGAHLGHWKQAIARHIFPRFYFLLDVDRSSVSTSGHRHQQAIPVFADSASHFDISLGAKNHFTFELSRGMFESIPFSGGDMDNVMMAAQYNQLIQQQLVVPGFSRQVSETSAMSLSAVFAFQSYADLSLGSLLQPDENVLEYVSPAVETSRGVGARLGFVKRLGQRMKVRGHLQTRINMDTFSRVHGVYSEPGDFDLPARAGLDLAIQTTSEGTVNLKAEQTLYSGINAFPTKALPERFLTLLQDGTSPEFAWRDLMVYSVGYEQRLGKSSSMGIEVSTRRQPQPTSDILALVLDQAVADYSMRLSFNTQVQGGQLQFYASYAPKPLIFGRTELGQVNRAFGRHTEAVVIWARSF